MRGRFSRLDGTDFKIIAGSACFWAWLDALFMSAFFPGSHGGGLAPEVAVMLVFGLSAFGFIGFLLRPAVADRLIRQRRVPIAVAALGTAGSLLFAFSGMVGTAGLLVAGGLAGAVFMALFQLGWGAVYSQKGSKSAALYASGGFAGAVIIDLPLQFMFPLAAAIFYALLPLASGVVFVTLDAERRSYHLPPRPLAAEAPLAVRAEKSLGVSASVLFAAALVLTSFGYLQHLVSFSSIASGGVSGGVAIQFVRGFVAIALFVIVVARPERTTVVYRLGLLLMIAGFMVMPFLFGGRLFWISGAIIISGYTIFDLLLWVLFCQIAYTRSQNPLQTIAAIKLIAVVCYVVGALAGIILVGNSQAPHPYALPETTLMGYFVVISTVLLLSSKDMWVLSGMGAFGDGGEHAREERLGRWFDEEGLTPREREIALLLVAGRTQPWVAESLCISENTVGTHVRHIYQKLGVHDRQQFIDRANDQLSTVSPDSREA